MQLLRARIVSSACVVFTISTVSAGAQTEKPSREKDVNLPPAFEASLCRKVGNVVVCPEFRFDEKQFQAVTSVLKRENM